MDIEGATFLYALAGLMITFAGFSALLLGLRQAAGGRVSVLDRYLARTVMTYVFFLTAGALLPLLLALYDIPEKWLWRIAAVLFALAYGIYLRSRICAVLVLVNHLLGAARLFAGMSGVPSTELAVTLVLTVLYVLGVIGTFVHHARRHPAAA